MPKPFNLTSRYWLTDLTRYAMHIMNSPSQEYLNPFSRAPVSKEEFRKRKMPLKSKLIWLLISFNKICLGTTHKIRKMLWIWGKNILLRKTIFTLKFQFTKKGEESTELYGASNCRTGHKVIIRFIFCQQEKSRCWYLVKGKLPKKSFRKFSLFRGAGPGFLIFLWNFGHHFLY